jgi:UrcA family protein
MNSKLFSALMLSTAFAMSPLAQANDVSSVVVKYGDLDLNAAQGVSALYARITMAARAVCAPLNLSGDILSREMKPKYDACVANGTNDAVAKVNRIALTELASSKTKTIRVATR